MARGQADYGMYASKSVAASLSDMGELAVRLGSPDTFDRRGDVVILDDFESPVLKWTLVLPNNSTIILDSTSVKIGAQAIKITSDAVAGILPYMSKRFHTLGSDRIGSEISFSTPLTTYVFYFTIVKYDGTNVTWGEIRIDFSAGKLITRDNVSGFVDVATGLSFYSLAQEFFPVKLVVDFSAGKYARVLVGDSEYDLSSYTLMSAADAALPHQRSEIGIVNDGTGTAASIWLDVFILTQNEP